MTTHGHRSTEVFSRGAWAAPRPIPATIVARPSLAGGAAGTRGDLLPSGSRAAVAW